MTERFNFYDIYGYVIPGLTFASLLWLPFGITEHNWPNLEWSSAFIVLVAAYITGFLINRLTEYFVSAGKYDTFLKATRLPSDLLLDLDPNTNAPRRVFKAQLSPEVRAFVVDGIKEVFGLDVDQNAKLRRDAFLLCRRLLQAEAAATPSYAEQFQGLYTFCLTTSSVFLLISYYYLAWVSSRWISEGYATGMCIVSLLVLVGLHREKWALLGFTGAMFGLGAILGGKSSLSADTAPTLLLLAIVTAALAFPFFSAFRYFSGIFAVTTYRDFYVLLRRPRKTSEHGDD